MLQLCLDEVLLVDGVNVTLNIESTCCRNVSWHQWHLEEEEGDNSTTKSESICSNYSIFGSFGAISFRLKRNICLARGLQPNDRWEECKIRGLIHPYRTKNHILVFLTVIKISEDYQRQVLPCTSLILSLSLWNNCQRSQLLGHLFQRAVIEVEPT